MRPSGPCSPGRGHQRLRPRRPLVRQRGRPLPPQRMERGAGRPAADASAPDHPPRLAAAGLPGTYWQAAPGRTGAALTLTFPQEETVSCVVLGEYLPAGQRIEAGRIEADGRTIASFTVV